MSAFTGFPRELLAYLDDLAEHNDRDWFNAHKDRYTTAWLEPAIAFCDALAPRAARMDPPVTVDPRVNGSIWRIQRDTRFSPDKTPYKTHLGFRFWFGDDKKRNAGFYTSVNLHGDVRIGGGLFGLDKPGVARLRAALDGRPGEALARIVADLEGRGWTLPEPALKRVPRGFDADHPRADLLRLEHLYMGTTLRPGAAVHTPAIVDAVANAYEQVAPVARWVQEHVFT